jgi:hypothetical protein
MGTLQTAVEAEQDRRERRLADLAAGLERHAGCRPVDCPIARGRMRLLAEVLGLREAPVAVLDPSGGRELDF